MDRLFGKLYTVLVKYGKKDQEKNEENENKESERKEYDEHGGGGGGGGYEKGRETQQNIFITFATI